MASKKANSKFNLATQPSIPVKYRCKVGGEWKPLDAFSKNQQRFIQFQIDRRHPIDAANSGMTCKEHTSGQRTEMTCELCGLVKPLSEFSGNSKRHESAHCKRCTAWMETQEPEVVPAPLETGHISVEEERGEMWPASFVDDTDFFSDDLLPQAPVTGLSSLGLGDIDPSLLDISSILSSRLAHSASGAVAKPGPKYISPHLKVKMAKSETTFISPVEKPKDADTSSQASLRKQLPPHLRGIMMQQSTPSQHANASDYAPSESDFNPSSISTATTAREMKDASKPRRVSFNAWDPTGVPHRNVKSLTASSIVDSSSKAPSDAGEGQTSSANFGVSGRNNWVKSKDMRMTQTELRQAGTSHHLAARQVGPVKHRPEQHNFDDFCEPDDDDDD
ncbi:uncharacterized protein TrAFT101_010971 [Trichoderma asperellum]|uniref:uncharacterized protein n=1 Tax=Trichoderma asperellum TaxID=101201 RepID=UPI0033317F51|nr:hypothetical protein TrAFT101_010971 [Trichoderma asperellum]